MLKNNIVATDLDGTLVDSESAVVQAYHLSLSEFGIELNQMELHSFIRGRNYIDFLKEILNSNDIDLFNAIRDKKNQYYMQLIPNLQINIGLVQLLKHLKLNSKIALVTNSGRLTTEAILKAHDLNFFDYILTGDDFHLKKPDAECYMKVLSYFNVTGDNLIIFEDSQVGLEAALQVTKNVIQVNLF